MSKRLSYRGNIIPGTDAVKIKLATLSGKVGYKIRKFEIFPSIPGNPTSSNGVEYVFQVFDKNTATAATVDFTNDSLLAVAYYTDHKDAHNQTKGTLIHFDDKVVNQDIFVTGADAIGGTDACNFYLELETSKLTDMEATMLTLKNLRTIASK